MHDNTGNFESLEIHGEMEKSLVKPYPPIVERVIKIFALTALTIGVAIIILIIYAMLFAYR